MNKWIDDEKSKGKGMNLRGVADKIISQGNCLPGDFNTPVLRDAATLEVGGEMAEITIMKIHNQIQIQRDLK